MTIVKNRELYKNSQFISKTLLCVLIFVVSLMITQAISAQGLIKCRDGIIDLSAYNFEDNGNVRLNGEWKFFNEQFLEPEQIKNDSMYCFVSVPENLSGQVSNGQEIGEKGFGTYYLQIIVNKKYRHKVFSLNSKRVSTASEIFINGELIGYNGVVSSIEQKSQPSLIMHFNEFRCNSDTLDLVIHVSNFHTQKFGLFYNIELGLKDQIHQGKIKMIVINILATGAILFMMFHFLVLYLLRRKDKTSLYFVFMSLFAFIYVLRLSGIYFSVMPNFGYEINYKVQLIALFSYTGMLMVYVRKIFPLEFSKKILHVILIISFVFIVGTIIFPVKINSHFLFYYDFFCFSALFYMFFAVLKAVVKKRDGSVTFNIGLFFLCTASLNDFLYELQVINTASLIPLGLFLFLFSQVIFLSLNFTKAFLSSEKLSEELSLINKNLENIVAQRTKEITHKTEELERKNNELIELGTFKHDMIGMLAHDLKNSLNVVINLAANKYVKYAGYVMHNLIMNFLDINKSENAKLKINNGRFDLTAIIMDAVVQTMLVAEQKSIIVNNKVPQGLMVFVDKELILRVIVNLITNAVKYSQAGKEIVVESVIVNKGNEKWVEVSFTDFGEGIKTENQIRVFDRYFSDGKKSGAISATGLGLAFCKMAIEAHKGSISVRSEKGVFTTFTVTLKMDEKQSDLINRSVDNAQKFHLSFNEKELEYLKPFVLKLSKCKIYQISDLRAILNMVDSNRSEDIRLWKEHMQQVIYNCNTDEFEYLIKRVGKTLG